MSLYLDTAYIAKCYLNEPDALRVRRVVREADQLVSSALCLPEMACLFHRRVREGALLSGEAGELERSFRADVDKGVWSLLPVSEVLLRSVATRMRKLPRETLLRAGDAIHLVTAQEGGFSEIWSNDRRLLAAAPFFNLEGRSV